jgi:hypothetical protein
MMKVKNYSKDDLLKGIGHSVDNIKTAYEKEICNIKVELGETLEKLDKKKKYVKTLLEHKEKAIMKVDRGTQFTVVDVFNLGNFFGSKINNRRSG